MPNRLREGEPQTRVHVWLFERDIIRIRAMFGKRMGPSRVLRTVLRKFLDQLEARASADGSAKPFTLTEDTFDNAQESNENDNPHTDRSDGVGRGPGSAGAT